MPGSPDDVVELGFGTGHSIGYLPATVAGIWGIEPSALARRYAQPRIDSSSVPVTLAGLDGQASSRRDDRHDALAPGACQRAALKCHCGRLVEQQQLWLMEQGKPELGAHALPKAELTGQLGQ